MRVLDAAGRFRLLGPADVSPTSISAQHALKEADFLGDYLYRLALVSGPTIGTPALIASSWRIAAKTRRRSH